MVACMGCSTQKNIYKSRVDNAVNIERMPYFPELSGDSLFWELTKDKKIIPYLIERISDTTLTKAPVLFFGVDYRIGDVCVSAIGKLIPDFRAVDLIESDQRVIDDKGYGVYWEYVRNNLENRKEFQKRVKKWYQRVKNKLVWVEDNNLYATEDVVEVSENSKLKKLPAGGFYRIKEKSNR